MSLIIRQALAKNAQEKRAMQAQWNHVQELRNAGDPAMRAFLQMTNAGRSPAEAYREFDATTKIEVNPMGEFATLTRLMQKARPVNIGKTLYEYRKSSDMDNGQTSMSGQIGVKLDHTDYGYAGVIVPVHDKGFGRSWRNVEAMRSEGFDALVDDAREAELGLMRTMNSFLFAGNVGLSVDGQKWLGLTSGSESTVDTYVPTIDISSSTATAIEIQTEIKTARDRLRITNNCVNPVRLGVSAAAMSNMEKFVSADTWWSGTIKDLVLKLEGIAEIYIDSALTGGKFIMYWDDQMGLHPVVGMGINTYAVPRQFHNSDFAFVKWSAVGFCAKTSFSGKKCVLFGNK